MLNSKTLCLCDKTKSFHSDYFLLLRSSDSYPDFSFRKNNNQSLQSKTLAKRVEGTTEYFRSHSNRMK